MVKFSSFLMRVSVCLVIMFSANMASAENPYVKMRLSNGITFEVPENWQIFDESTKTTIIASVVAKFPSAVKVEAETPFWAYLHDSQGVLIGHMNIRLYPKKKESQRDVKKYSPAKIKKINASYKEAIKKAVALYDVELIDWYGTTRREINGKVYLVASYKRGPRDSNDDVSKISLVRLLNGKNSLTMTISYHERHEFLLKPIVEHIRDSLVVP